VGVPVEPFHSSVPPIEFHDLYDVISALLEENFGVPVIRADAVLLGNLMPFT
jgi:hypothetical protein